MTNHAPLTASQIALAHGLETSRIRMTHQELSQSPMGKDLTFLMNAGFVMGEQVYIAQSILDTIVEFTRTAKPLD